MKIDAIYLRELNLPLVRPFQTSFGITKDRRVVLAEVHSEGLIGWGECTAGEHPHFSEESVDSCWQVIVDELGPTSVRGHIELSSDHHTPWGIVHGGVYATAVETAASIGASRAVEERGQVAVGLTNTTHFLRSLTSGRVKVEAVALYQGRTHQLWRVDVTEESGRLVAHGELRLQNVEAAK